jgi:hypothetical protein
MSAREPLVSGWFRDKEEGLLMKCVWQRTVPRGESGEEALRTVWLCEDSRGFSVRVEEVDAGGQRHVLWHTRPIPEGLLRTDIRNVARVARGIREAARALSGWISQSGILEGAERRAATWARAVADGPVVSARSAQSPLGTTPEFPRGNGLVGQGAAEKATRHKTRRGLYGPPISYWPRLGQ